MAISRSFIVSPIDYIINTLIKIMDEARRSAVGRSLPTSIFEKFEGIYNEE